MSVQLFTFIKYMISGICGVGLHFSTTFLLVEKLKIKKYYGNTFGLISGLIFNYFINRHWTYSTEESNLISEASRFILVAFFCLVLNHFIVKFVHEKMTKGFYYSKFISVVILVLVKFYLHTIFTFI